MERATNGFSEDSFLSEGGFGPVHKGVLEDGQVIAVKKHKKASAQGASEFCSEVEVLSCAQHKNLVMLVGYCVEGQEWLLVYEFACNGSLDEHLHCKVPQNLLTSPISILFKLHICEGLIEDKPPVGDLGLARWQTDGQTAEETCIVGAIGCNLHLCRYLAPEYSQTGRITEKADVYAFGLLLIELIRGLKIIDLMRHEKLHQLQWVSYHINT
ncbi:inactive protein kinase SELMODRAFT_444075-like [Asparagus officinalis]|uniref:inactive protein kinase SELMODRAFT_444075-like n=1 Tax=Asparagus officinalis TaxID=4686 RepID=UPI00098E6381|nr:inactive protein kinase SELMODRAFT_444075-like [Asparagus officinalis]